MTEPSETQSDRFPQFTRLAVKELREILRDRRTIITLVLMPLFLYPLLGGVVQKVLLSQFKGVNKSPAYVLGFENEQQYKRFRDEVGLKEDDDPAAAAKATDTAETPEEAIEAMLNADAEPSFSASFPDDGTTADLDQLVAEGVVDVGIRFAPHNGAPGSTNVELICRQGSRHARSVVNEVLAHISAANTRWRERILADNSLPVEPPFQTATRKVTAVGARSAFSLVTFIPLALILMTVTGAVYPAIDLTAGERERGTLETLIAAPISRLGLLMAKFVAVVTVAMLTAMINLLAMLITLYSIRLDESVFGAGGITATTFGLIVVLLFVFAGFFSAVLLSLTSFARSFKEAQAYLIPLMLVALTPGIFSLMPDVKMNVWLALTPLVNVVLTARDVLQGEFDISLLMLSVCATVVYGLIALLVAARVFGTDSILYGSEGTWSDLLHRPSHAGAYPGVLIGATALVVLVPAYILLASVTGRIEDISLNTRLLLTMLVQSLFVLVPASLVWWNRCSFRATFSLHRPALPALGAAVVLGTCLWPFAYELSVLTQSESRHMELFELFSPLKDLILSIPLPLRLLALAIVPAVCEEWFFRGILLSSMRGAPEQRRRSGDIAAVLITAAMFGAFHVLVRDKLFFERFLPTCLMGLVLGFVCVRTNSIVPGMILHVSHNALLLSFDEFKDRFPSLHLENQRHLPWTWIAGATVIAAIGFGLLAAAPRLADASDQTQS